MVDGRPQRPNSIEVPNHYPSNSYPNAYSPTHETNNVPHGFSPSYNNTYGAQPPYTTNGKYFQACILLFYINFFQQWGVVARVFVVIIYVLSNAHNFNF